ncbi:uncharacterized protein RCC_08276 [Ramularia collo-cygni]|uniref:Uncharacterized protein n=1 Tax=Ramularia collo-cygni TaxID=112498 RepID=A0A2D3VEU7_9PEZI|nr:uncharacterized protein RCC_08276 [Ramularia collo-cygni]CZT22406.1 uncharacterized protein RCC_08276 [Ramularia collo-cygni]
MNTVASTETSAGRRSARIISQGGPKAWPADTFGPESSERDSPSSEEVTQDENWASDEEDLHENEVIVDSDIPRPSKTQSYGGGLKKHGQRSDEYRSGPKRPHQQSDLDPNHDQKRRCTTGEHEDEHDEEPRPLGRDAIRPKLELPTSYPTTASGQSHVLASDERKVKLVIKSIDQISMNFYVRLSSIDKIGSLSRQLQVPMDASMQQFECSTLSEENAIFQAIGYLEGVHLTPLSSETNASGMLKQLYERIKLFDLSQELNIVVLEIAVLEGLFDHLVLDAGTFAQFARACYDRKAGHRIERDSTLGQLVKAGLSRLMPELIASGIADDLRKARGPLAEELMDVVWKRHIKLEQQRVARVIADRDVLE